MSLIKKKKKDKRRAQTSKPREKLVEKKFNNVYSATYMYVAPSYRYKEKFPSKSLPVVFITQCLVHGKCYIESDGVFCLLVFL